MRNYTNKAVAAAVAVLLFILLGFNSTAQQIPKADNTVHDKMYQLLNRSDKVVLPAEVTEHINTINQDNPYKTKVIHAQLRILKVLYNKTLPKEDVLFFGNQLLKNNTGMYLPIHSDIKKILDKL